MACGFFVFYFVVRFLNQFPKNFAMKHGLTAIGRGVGILALPLFPVIKYFFMGVPSLNTCIPPLRLTFVSSVPFSLNWKTLFDASMMYFKVFSLTCTIMG